MGEDSVVDGSFVPPAARPLDEFTATEVGEDEVVLFDHSRMTYHTLNRLAYQIWRACDGERSIHEVAQAVDASFGAAVVAESDLSDAGLLKSEVGLDRKIGRRKLLAAGIGATIPMVLSISAPIVGAYPDPLPNGAICAEGDPCADSPTGTPYCCAFGSVNGSGFRCIPVSMQNTGGSTPDFLTDLWGACT